MDFFPGNDICIDIYIMFIFSIFNKSYIQNRVICTHA